jgi:hypothetical protein
MATTTPLNGWPVPTSTDYVKDGATSIEALGDAIDTSAGRTWLAWQTWTPVFSQPGTIAGGTINAAYVKIGKTVIARCAYTFTNTGVSGALTSTLPLAAKSAGIYTVGSFNFLDTGTNFYNGVCRLDSATSVLSFFNGGTVGNTLGNSPTFSAAIGDIMNFVITYETT